jgi:Domain of unknown function (DUF4276)
VKLFVLVEGQGEEAALPVILRRIAAAEARTLVLAGRPWREPRQRLLLAEHLGRVLQVARARADAALIVLDADDDCAVAVADAIRRLAEQLVPGFRVLVVVAVREFEAWFLAAAESLRGARGLPLDLARPPALESVRDAKGWLSARLPRRYSPTLDQPALAAVFDLEEARAHSRSFRKLLKEVQSALEPMV